MQNNLGLFLSKRALLSPTREAYVESDGSLRLTYTELNNRCNQLANSFLAAGIAKGERVGLLLMNSSEFMESYYALAKIGAVVVPLNWRLVADELEFILKDSGTTRLIFDNEFVDTVAELHSRGDKTDIKQWLHVTHEDEAHFAENYRAFRNVGDISEPKQSRRSRHALHYVHLRNDWFAQGGRAHTPYIDLGSAYHWRYSGLP